MPSSPLETFGAAIQPISAAPLHTNEFFTGLWTNGNPLGPGPVPFLYQRFYNASRFDRLIDGGDVEISSHLTLIRRPGQTVYNPGPFPAVNRFYEFRGFSATDEVIHVLADCDDSTVREVTQPSTNTVLWTKDPAAGRTSFVSDGNVLYAGDGTNTHQWVTSAQAWQASTLYQPGAIIVDSNGNIQMAMGAQTANLTNIEVDVSSHVVVSPPSHTYYYSVDLFFSSTTPLEIKPGVLLTLAGLTTVPWMNGTTNFSPQSQTQVNTVIITSSGANPAVPYTTETGTATTGTGITGSTAPAWGTTLGEVTQDGGNQWVMVGNSVMPWGGVGPASPPIVTQTAAPGLPPHWLPNTWYAPSFQIVDPNGNLQQLIGPAPPAQIETGNSAPTWATTPGAITTESVGSGANAQWKCIGPAAWQGAHAYAVGDSVQATYSYWVTTVQFQWQYKNGIPVQVPVQTQTQVNATSLFICTIAGTSNTSPPSWVNGLNTLTSEATPSTVVWQNQGNAPGWPGASQLLSLVTKISDKNFNIETVTHMGESGPGPSEPTWNTAGQGSFTADNTTSWRNDGPFAAAATQPWQWAYSGKNSITGEISNASPVSLPFVPSAGQVPVIQGQGLPNHPWDTIVLWRTAAGGSTLLYDDEFPNPGPTAQWVYTDTNLDPGNVATGAQGTLNAQIIAPINNSNDPPPSSFLPMAYYLGRIWGYVNNQLRWSGGPDTGTGNGNSTFPAVNQYRFPAKGVYCWPTSVGLICYTTADIWAVLGQGTPNSPFYVVNFQAGIGLSSQDAFAINGSTAYGMLTSHQVVSMDPGAGEVEVGFPLGDIFDANFDPTLAYLTWHQGRSSDTALYVANGSTEWFRMAAVSAPESGNVWSPAATIHAPGQVRAMMSVEITPGNKVLLVGPNVDGNPILKRDATVNSDNGVAYAAHATIAPVILAQPGTTAGVQFVVVEEKLFSSASAMTVKMLFDEIMDISASDWRALRNGSLDPPNLPKSKSLRIQRLWGQQDPSTIIKCRFYEQDISWPAENFPSELLTNTVYGRLPEKARK